MAKTAIEASRAAEARRAEVNTVANEVNVARSIPPRMQTTPYFTPKRQRASPGDARPGGSKKHKEASVTEVQPTLEATDEVNSHSSWQVVGRKKGKAKKKTRPEKPKLVRRKNKGEALIVKASGDSYVEVLRAMRTNPNLNELGADVKKIKRTRNGEMILLLKKEPKASSVSYKELTEKALGNMVEVIALCPEATITCKDLDEITSEEDIRLALKEQCELGEVRMSIRIRNGPSGTKVAAIKLPIDAANKVLRIGIVRVGWSECPLSVSEPEVCFRCQEFGHIARYCKGPDRSNLCRRCGEEGHKAQGCSKPPKCLICANTKDSSNHATGGTKCAAFKRASTTKPQWR